MFEWLTNWCRNKSQSYQTTEGLMKSGPCQHGSAQDLYLMLRDRNSAEIAARLLRRSELFGEDKNPFLNRCAALDQAAADQISRLVALANPAQDIQPWLSVRDRMLDQLREDAGK